MKRKLLSLVLLFAAAAASSHIALSQTPPPPLVSPDVHPDHTVTFRFRDPNAKEVAVQLEGSSKPVPMQKDDHGVWSITTDPLTPDYYGYSFLADGVGLLDPSNYRVKPNFLYRSNEVHVPGPPSLSWEIAAVPHGEIHHHFYESAVVGDHRGFFVYTPPGYDPRAKLTYPVLYLLHGYSDNAEAWTAVGRANIILDNLIAQGKAKPMLVVMPLGSGGITPEFDKEFPALDAKTNQQLHLLWIACGTDDHLIEINRNLRTWLASKSIKHADVETPGSHTWMVWRRNLTDFAPLLFR